MRTYVLQLVGQTTIKTELLVAKRNFEVAPNRPFSIIVANMLNFPKLVHKYTMPAELTERPATMVSMIENSPTDASVDFLNAVPVYNEKINKDEQFRLYQELKTFDRPKDKDDWRHQLSFNSNYDDYRPVSETMMSKYDSM